MNEATTAYEPDKTKMSVQQVRQRLCRHNPMNNLDYRYKTIVTFCFKGGGLRFTGQTEDKRTVSSKNDQTKTDLKKIPLLVEPLFAGSIKVLVESYLLIFCTFIIHYSSERSRRVWVESSNQQTDLIQVLNL